MKSAAQYNIAIQTKLDPDEEQDKEENGERSEGSERSIGDGIINNQLHQNEIDSKSVNLGQIYGKKEQYSNQKDDISTKVSKENIEKGEETSIEHTQRSRDHQYPIPDDMPGRLDKEEETSSSFSDHPNKTVDKSNNLFEWHYCNDFGLIDNKRNYEKHIVSKHPKKPAYPSLADLEKYGITPKGKSWEI